MFEKTKAFCDSLLKAGVPGFDLAVYHRGECVLRHRNGFRDVENRISMNGKERFNIYSCSKPITCTAAMQLWEQGLFSLEDTLSDYLPEFAEMTVQTENGIRPATRPILIRHLFEMTAGFSYNVHTSHLSQCKTDTGGRCPTRETMRYLAKDPLSFEPGERWQYSLCHDVLGALVEVVSGEKFEEYVQTHIFDVVGMNDSTFLLPEAALDTLSPQYRFVNGDLQNVGKSISSFKLGSEYASGGAGCVSTVDDYMKFLEALRTGVLLKPDTLTLMTANRLTEQQAHAFTMKDTHGYGLGVRCSKGVAGFEDFGWGGAAGSWLAIDQKRELSLFLGMHLLSSPVQGVRSMLYRAVRADLFYPDEWSEITAKLKTLYRYDRTY